VAKTFQNFTACCNIKMPSFYDYAAAAAAILLNFNGIFSSANCRMH